ncbi:hypothetical protein GPECTOR_117g365 [Gonium pectorale]|uniref:Uncharacterized protein n=1 Tax=Gonium pectorale TaxID=33097 RepID=A0A150G0F8_GONPE|nr:hypothetical protein GPECTOR_117g365 [Gonium pectorale]|eukprot:KXZ42800.1 hypothetical protein GPECTOR_117g365 [Gonium pectorale]
MQLRWCSTWQQMRQVYDNLLRAEAEALAAAASASAAAAATAAAAAAAISPASAATVSSSGNTATISGASVDVTADAVAIAVAVGGGSGATAGASAASASASSPSPVSVPGLLSRDETYAFLLQLQDFYHLRLREAELAELQAFRCRLVRDLSTYVRRLNAEQLEAMCCASAVSGKCLSKEKADAVQERLLKILTITTTATAHGHAHANGNGNGASSASSSIAASSSSSSLTGRRRAAPSSPGGFQVLTPALNTIFALYDHGYLPQVALLQAVFRQAVDHCCEVTRSQWHGLNGLARKFRFMVDDAWLDDLHAALRDPLLCTSDFGRMASILGCIAAFTVNKAMEALDTRVLVVVETIERRYDEGRSLLSAHQLCVFTALLVDMRSPFRTKWRGYCLDHLASCSSHIASLPPASLLLAVELVLRGRGWEDTRLLSRLLRRLFATYATHPTASLRATPNVAGGPPRVASRIISAASASSLSSSAAASSPSSSATPHPSAASLAALAAAAAWDVEVGGAGGAASPPIDLVSLVDWLASKVPTSPGPDRDDTLAFLRPLVTDLIESSRPQLTAIEPRRIPCLIRAVSQLGYSPSREWVSDAFGLVARGAEGLSGGELVAMLRLSHAQRLPLPAPTLDAVCAQHGRILPLMRAIDLQRLLECWVADRYIPSKEQLEGFFDAVCDSFGLDLAALKDAASASSAAASAPGSAASMSYDSGFGPGAGSGSGSGAAGSKPGSGSGGSRSRSGPAVYLDVDPLQTVSGGVSAGAADGVAGDLPSGSPRQPTPAAPAAPASQTGSGSRVSSTDPTEAHTQPEPAAASAAFAAATTAAAAATAADAVVAATTAAIAAAATAAAAAAASKSRGGSTGSMDEKRPKGSLLQPAEAQTMLTLLDQYRSLLLEARRSELLIVMNTYRNAVTAALHDMRRKSGGAGGGGGRQPASSRLLQAVLRGGGDISAGPADRFFP